MSKEKKSDLDRRRFLSSSAKLAAGATAAANFPKELFAAQGGRPASPLIDSVEQTDTILETGQDRISRQALTTGTRDLSATIQQTAADKVLGSVSYPFCVFEKSWPFNGRAEADLGSYIYTKSQNEKLLKDAQSAGQLGIESETHTVENQFSTDVLRAGAEVIESAKKCLDARAEAERTGKRFEGPSKKVCQDILDGGVSGLASIRGIEFKAHLAWLKICIADRPSVRLGNPRIAITGVNVLASATGELWWYHPTFHCSWLCFVWKVTWGWDRITDITVNNIRIAADAHADTSTEGAIVTVRGKFDRLRLDYPVLREIPLEGIANQQLADKLVRVFDASQFIASIPVMSSKFRIDKIELPAVSNEIAIDLSIKQI